jgi:histidine triad (HIT) family protein
MYTVLATPNLEVQPMDDCVFCHIVAGESPASVFHEDDVVLGLMDIGPVTRGHAMIIPKEHVSSILDPMALDGELLSSMVLAVQKTAWKLGLDEEGFYVRTNAAAPGVTPHMHWRVVGPGIS